MADSNPSYVRHEMLPAQPAPIATGNIVGWIRVNLLATPKDIVLTILALAVLALAIPPALNWLFLQASWFGSDRSVCATVVQGGIQPGL